MREKERKREGVDYFRPKREKEKRKPSFTDWLSHSIQPAVIS